MGTNATPGFKELHSHVRKLVKETLNPNFEKVEKEARIPEAIVDKFRSLGLFGMSIPRQYGGLGLTTIEEMSLIEEMTYTNADAARLFTTIAVTDEKKRARGGVTAFLVERGTPGFSIGPTDLKMGFKRSHTCELVFKDCRVPKDNVIGGMGMVGQGFKTAMCVLDKGRLVAGACLWGCPENHGHLHRSSEEKPGFRETQK